LAKNNKNLRETTSLDGLVLGRLSPIWILALVVGWWVFVLCSYYRDPTVQLGIPSLIRFISPQTNISLGWLLDNLKLVGIFAWFILLGLGLGNLSLIFLKLPLENRLEWAAMSVGLGWGFLGLIFGGLGFFKLWSPYPVYGFLLLLSVGLAIAAVKMKMGPGHSAEARSISSMEKFMWGLLSLAIFLNLVGALMPEIFYDALVYHLALPELYWIKGGLFPTPYNLYSGFPQLMEMLYGLALPFGDRLCHLIHCGFGILTALLACGFCRRLRRPNAGLMAALLFYSTPLVGVLSCKSGVELGQTFFQFLAIYALAVGLNDQGSRSRWLLLSGIAMGLTMGVKYTAWPFLGLIAVVVFFDSFQKGSGWGVSFRNSLLYVLPAALLAAPWLARNLIFYHNPIFPFFHGFFVPNGPQVHWEALAGEGRSRDILALFTSWSGIKSFLITPWLIGTQGYALNCLGPILILGLPLLVLFRYQGQPLRMFLGAALGLFGLLCLLTTMPRFFLPAIPFMALAYAVAIQDGFQSSWKWVAQIFFLAIVFINLLATASFYGIYDAQDAIWGVQSEGTYLSRQHPSYDGLYYPAASFIRNNLPKTVRVLVVGEGRGYGIGRDYVASPQFNESILSQCMNKSQTPAALRECIKDGGFTHILFNNARMYYQGDIWGQAILAKPDLWLAFTQRYVRPIFEVGDPESAKSTSVWCSVGEIE
jgi:hypothetical protein